MLFKLGVLGDCDDRRVRHHLGTSICLQM